MPLWTPFGAGGVTNVALQPAAAAGYQGPGDQVSGWTAWWGNRSFKAAGNPINWIDITFSDAHVETYQTASSGGGINLSVGSPSGVSYASSLGTHGGPTQVTKWYDQTGNGRHLANGVPPAFNLTALGSFPGTEFAGSNYLDSPAVTQAIPFTVSLVAEVTSSGVAFQAFVANASAALDSAFYHNSPDTWFQYGFGSAGRNVLAANSVFHAGIFVNNDTSSFVTVDLTDTTDTGASGTQGYSSQAIRVGSDTALANWLTGNIIEVGINNADLTSIRASLISNQRAYYGF